MHSKVMLAIAGILINISYFENTYTICSGTCISMRFLLFGVIIFVILYYNFSIEYENYEEGANYE